MAYSEYNYYTTLTQIYVPLPSAVVPGEYFRQRLVWDKVLKNPASMRLQISHVCNKIT